MNNCLIALNLALAAGIGFPQSLGAAPPAEKRPGGRLVLPTAPAPKRPVATPLVTVNGKPINAVDLQWGFQIQKIPVDQQQTRQREVLERLVDESLIQQFLSSRKIAADRAEVTHRLERLKIAAGLGPEANPNPKVPRTPAAYAFDEERFRGEISAALAWQKYLDTAISPQTLREYFGKHKPQFDGTELRASHIVLLVSTDRESEGLKEADARLQSLREEIVQRKLTFADAARRFSQGPSREQGGDIGFFPFRGKMPAAFCDAAFRLKEGEVSPPFQTPFGVHLCVVTGRKPGELSLEDARPSVWRGLSQEIRQQRIAELRAKAKIEWVTGPEQKPPAKP